MKLKLDKEFTGGTVPHTKTEAVDTAANKTTVNTAKTELKKDKPVSLVEKEARLEDLMQNQVDHEFENARLYLAMAIWCHINGYIETAKFFSTHALEERKHGMDFLNTMLVLDMEVRQPITKEMKGDYDDLEELLEAAVDREIVTSVLIGKLHKCVPELQRNMLRSNLRRSSCLSQF